MSHFQVTKELIFDAAQVGDLLEAQFGMYLLPPPEGLYLPHQTQPVVRARQYYYQLSRSKDSTVAAEVPIKSLEDIHEDLYDQDHTVVVPKRLSKYLSVAPTLPVRGILLVADMVDWTIQNSAAWTKRKCPLVGTVIEQHLKEEYRTPEVIERVDNLLADIRTDVRQFIGRDTWVMFFHKLRRRDIIVERTVDFRIYDWERRMNSGEWT
jgi:hypothetical protein